ncbi:unnamed protein product [Phyllotreta striolata]|uniref:Globin domain-containing protein n=1 Tax=Phyllotreta striolata TaxID=444603 RepID=A0A9N9XL24_PHYSR|nr:unnamed protein product [Phyllotreta striolata]
MGGVWSWRGSNRTGRTDDPDPTTGLTSRDRYLIKSTWANIMESPTDNGVALLVLYFEKFPDAKGVFPFKDVPTAELSTNARFRAHCNSVIYAVASIVDSVDNIDLLVPILEKVGRSHAPRNVTNELFMQLKETMLELFGKIMKKEEVEAWKKALEVVFTVITKALADN